MADVDKGHPDYCEGYWAGLDGRRLHAPSNASPLYRKGFDAGVEARAIFARAGFSQDGATFSKSFSS